MTTEQETTNEPAPEPPAAAQWRPSRRARIAALVLAVLLVAGVTGGILATNHNAAAPAAAVRAYVEAIARGDASAANRMVDPASFADGVDPALLTDEVLRSAKQRIEVAEVNLSPGEDLSADVVDVQVEYSLGRQETTVLLRAKRAGTTAGVLRDWRVIDPLLVPVRVESTVPRLDTASLGAATVPVGGPGGNGWPERRFFVYPGVYELRGHESRYLTAAPQDVAATNTGYDERPANIDGQLARSYLSYQATPALTAAVTTRLDAHVTACFAAVPNVPRDCPWHVYAYADFATGMRLARRPRVESIEAYQVDYPSVRAAAQPLRFTTDDGELTYTNEDGQPRRENFSAHGQIGVTPDDDLTVTFTGGL